MKYFTKEWYELCQQTSYHLSLEEDERATTFSEDYFQELYNKGLAEWLELQEEVALIMETTEFATHEGPIKSEPFIKEQAIEQFQSSFHYNQLHLKEGLPESILKQVADIRVLALNRATRPVINAITQFCEGNEKAVTSAGEAYRKYYQEASSSIETEINKNFGFHDCTVMKAIENGKSLTLHLDNSGGFTTIDEVTFENFAILKQDGSLENSWWLYEEIYKVDDKYEFHALLQHPRMGLIDVIISADRVSFKREGENYQSVK